MSVVNVSLRHTTDWNEYIKHSKSVNSLIFIYGDVHLSNGDELSLDLSVGETIWQYKNRKNFKIPEDGIQLKPGESIVIETMQQIALPFNILGIVVGRGSYIFRGVFLSPGKIDPGFHGNLSIGFFNSGGSTITIRKGEKFCSCTFLNTETTLSNPPRRGKIAPTFDEFRKPIRITIIDFLRNHGTTIFTIIGTILAIPASLWYVDQISKWFLKAP